MENVPVSQQSGNLGQGRRRAIQTLVLVSDSLERQGNERSSLFYSFLLRRSTSSISETHICGRGFGYKVDGVALNSRDCVCGGPFSGQGSIDRRLNCGNSKTRNSEKFFGKKKKWTRDGRFSNHWTAGGNFGKHADGIFSDFLRFTVDYGPLPASVSSGTPLFFFFSFYE